MKILLLRLVLMMVLVIGGKINQVLEENLDWEDIQWSQAGVWIAGKEYPLVRIHFLSPN